MIRNAGRLTGVGAAALLCGALVTGGAVQLDAAAGPVAVKDQPAVRTAQAWQPGPGVRFATYNVRTSHLNNSWAGDDDAVYDRDDSLRMRRVATFVKDRKLDVIAAQEVGHKERHGIMSRLPANYRATGVVRNSDTVIIWNSTVWKHVATGHFPIRVRPGTSRPQVWMKLEHRQTRQRVVVLNVHLPAGDREPLRIEGAKRTVAKMRAIRNGLPVIVAGDMNGSDRYRLGAYRTFKGAGLTYTRETAQRRYGNHCDSHNARAGHGAQECRKTRGSHIDMVWVTSGVHVPRYNLVATATTSRTSDHNPLVTQLTLRRT